MHIRAKWEANRVSSNPQNFIMLGDQMLDIITKVEPLLSTGLPAHCACDQCRSARELLSVIRGANNEGSDMVQVQCRVKASKFPPSPDLSERDRRRLAAMPRLQRMRDHCRDGCCV
jgi:hypothetical protein